MSYLTDFSDEEIRHFEDLEFQKEKENILHWFKHGAHISTRHRQYCEQKKKAAKAAPARSSPSTDEDDQSATKSLRHEAHEDADLDIEEECPSPEGRNRTQERGSEPNVVTVSLNLIYSFSTLEEKRWFVSYRAN